MSDLTRLAGELGDYEELGNTFSWFSLRQKPHLWFLLGPGGWDKRSPSPDHATQGGCLSPLVALDFSALCTQCGNQGSSREMGAKGVDSPGVKVQLLRQPKLESNLTLGQVI